MTIQELITLCERATGGSRELDVAIHRVAGQAFEMEYWTEADTTPIENLSKVPQYTRSTDAAIALMHKTLPGWVYAISEPGIAWLTMVDMPPPPLHIRADAATPAIALVTATLRAHLQNSERTTP